MPAIYIMHPIVVFVVGLLFGMILTTTFLIAAQQEDAARKEKTKRFLEQCKRENESLEPPCFDR